MSRPWFLQRRITFAFGLTTLLLSLALVVPSGWMVLASLNAEIDALVHEELEEVRLSVSEGRPTSEQFALLASGLQAQHPHNPLAWRLWDEATGAAWGDFGATELLVHAPRAQPVHGDIRRLDGSTRLLAAPVGSGLNAALVLDGSDQLGRFRTFLWASLGFVLLATAVALLAGHLLGARVSRLLAAVARNASTADAPETWVPPHQAPEEIREVVHTLQESLQRIRAESENARLLISGLAHELRSPLQNMIGETQVALLREREPGEYRRVLESQLEELGELSGVVDNLVSLSSIHEARRRRSLERFDLAGEAQLRLARELKLAQRRGVEVVLAAEGPLPLEGDRESLLLALRNVVTNAIEWSPSGKTVEVRMRALAEELEITVDDAGPGVPPAEREHIFRPFHRGPAAKGRRVGFGLGLALTHSAVLAQGGSIEVGDSPLGGARFRILFPARGAAGRPALASEPAGSAREAAGLAG